MSVTIVPLETASLGDRNYLAHDGEVAFVVDPQRDIDRVLDLAAAHATGGPADWTDEDLGSFERATFADLAQVHHHRPVVVLGVRRESEHQESHIDDSVNIPLHEMARLTDDVPAGEVWVHCDGGYRASVAACFLAVGRHVAVDDSFDNARDAGLPLT